MKKSVTAEVIEKIYHYSLEEIMGERFGSYSKYIIQDRAIPDIRDGLKPVQRRILYSMYSSKNTYDKGYRKSAKAVGDVIGNYHPHGDSSIYEAMVRMSQSWKSRYAYIDMHGNNGSIDGDTPAAYRYTEARLSKISNELLKDIEKDTVVFAPNFDDTLLEPTVLPAKFPNLLVNGSTGISAGYATNIPPHNLGEVIDATIHLIDNPGCHLETLMGYIKGPDFPTGGIIEGIEGIKTAYETGRGKIMVKSRTVFEEDKSKLALIITEIPFEVNKAVLVRKIDEIRMDKKIDGILEVRDESDRDGLRVSIDLKKDCNRELILHYLLKNTDLQVSYNFNMIAIDKRRPRQVGLIQMLEAYVHHQKEVVLKRTQFDLAHAKTRLHIVEGLIKCLSILDQVIATIRASKNKVDAKENIAKEYGFTLEQAEAIVILQLYKLTNTDVTLLEEELRNLKLIVEKLEAILNSEAELRNVMKEELRKIRSEYGVPRITDIKDEITELKIDTSVMIPKEDCIVLVTKDGYVKRTSMRSYTSSNEPSTLKETDYILGLYELNTQDTLLLFTNMGNYLYVPVYELPDLKWKDLGKHISNIIKLDSEEVLISAIAVSSFETNQDIIISTTSGMIKRTLLSDFKLTRYSKPITCMKLKDHDEVVNAVITEYNDIFIATKHCYGLWFDIADVPIVGLKTSGVAAINLKNDEVVAVSNFDALNTDYVAIITDKGTGKRVKLTEFEKSSRKRRGLLLLREVKTNPYLIINAFLLDSKNYIGLKGEEINTIKLTELSIVDRYGTGNTVYKGLITSAFPVVELKEREQEQEKVKESIIPTIKEEPIPLKKTISLKEIDERLMTIDDFLDL
ncbi:MAG: DNA topoisomerase IV subunit A [Bacilli bacterium]